MKADLLISPCQCTGTAKYVHENCLKEWLGILVEKGAVKSRRKDKGNGKRMRCEVCNG